MIKQVVVVRKDLNMRKGKIAAQVAHASMMFLTEALRDAYRQEEQEDLGRWAVSDLYGPIQWEWINGSFAKIVVYVESEHELLEVSSAADRAGFRVCQCVDSGATEFHGEPTLTCIAIGPAKAEAIDEVTGHLPLL